MKACDIFIHPISKKDAEIIIKKYHYSKKVMNNSSLHFGVFMGKACEGAISLGPSIDKRKLIHLVKNTKWNGFLELNRMAFSDRLPKNSESRALGFVFRLIKKELPHVRWIVSFADATQCGDGCIYRATGFHLTQIKKNKDLFSYNGHAIHTLSLKTGCLAKELYSQTRGSSSLRTLIEKKQIKRLVGFQIRYIKILGGVKEDDINFKILPYSKIEEMNAKMYRGQKTHCASSIVGDAPKPHFGENGSTPIEALCKGIEED